MTFRLQRRASNKAGVPKSLFTRRLQQQLSRFILVMCVAFTGGCSEGTTIDLKDAVSGTPVVGVRVECYKRVSGAGKILNPVGAFYHSIRLRRGEHTDSQGLAAFPKSTVRDVYVIYPPNVRALLVSVWGKTIQVAPPVGQTNNLKWGYSVWVESEGLKSSVWPSQ